MEHCELAVCSDMGICNHETGICGCVDKTDMHYVMHIRSGGPPNRRLECNKDSGGWLSIKGRGVDDAT